MLRRLIGALLLLAIVATTGIYLLGRGLLGQHETPGEVTAIPLDTELLRDRRNEASRTLAALGERVPLGISTQYSNPSTFAG